MKKIIAILLCACLCLGLAFSMTACVGSDEKEKDSVSGGSGTASVVSGTVDASEDSNNGNTVTESSNSTVTAATDAELIVGKWSGKYDAADLAGEEGQEFAEMLGDVELELSMTFGSDGKIEAEITQESMNAYVDAIVKMYKENIVEITEASLEGTGMTFEQYLEQLEMTEQEYIDEALSELDAEAMKEEIAGENTMSGTYKLEGGKLYVTADIQDDEDDDGEEGVSYTLTADTLTLHEEGMSLTFKKVK